MLQYLYYVLHRRGLGDRLYPGALALFGAGGGVATLFARPTLARVVARPTLARAVARRHRSLFVEVKESTVALTRADQESNVTFETPGGCLKV